MKRFKIKNYETELEEAITNLEEQKTSLDKELAEKKDKLALGDTVTDFFIRETDYDFDKYCSFIDYVKKLRREKRPKIPEGDSDFNGEDTDGNNGGPETRLDIQRAKQDTVGP